MNNLNATVINSVVAQLYSRMTLAAAQGVYLHWSDLSPIVFGMHFDRVPDDMAESLWVLLGITMLTDSRANRPPLAALFISRKNGARTPNSRFFEMYAQYYGKEITIDDWSTLVANIWQSYRILDSDMDLLNEKR